MPAALHSLGCSAEEIASAMERRRVADAKEQYMKDEREKTERVELKARAKLAANPQLQQQQPPAVGAQTAKTAQNRQTTSAAAAPSSSSKTRPPKQTAPQSDESE